MMRFLWKHQVACLVVGLIGSAFLQDVARSQPKVLERSDPVMLLAFDFSADSALVATGGDSVRVYDAHSGGLLHQIRPPRLTRAVSFAPGNPKLLVAGCDDGAVRVWQLDRPDSARVLKSHSGMVTDVEFSPDGTLLVSGGVRLNKRGGREAGELRLWDVQSGKLLRALTHSEAGVGCVAFSPDGRLLAYAKNIGKEGTDSTVEIYDVQNWRRVRSIRFSPGFANSLSFTRDARRLIIAGGVCKRTSKTSCLPTGKMWLAALRGDDPATPLKTKRSMYFRSISTTPDGKRFATGTTIRGFQTEIQMREADTGEVLWRQPGRTGEPYGTAVSPDGKLVGCCSGNEILLLDARSGKTARTISASE